jgi:3-hydroxy-9,10-secoandrosta-1,3,5(10)-triene-9,17-dione monooxygenase reductase component
MFTIHSLSGTGGTAIGRALGRVPSGLFVLSVGQKPEVHATLVSWVQQVGFDPPAICVALAKDRPMLATVQRLGRFALSVLGKSQSAQFKRFARPIPGPDPFEGIDVRTTPGGLTVLADAVAWLECTVLQISNFHGDHHLVIARIAAGEVANEEPAFTHQRGNGMHY